LEGSVEDRQRNSQSTNTAFSRCKDIPKAATQRTRSEEGLERDRERLKNGQGSQAGRESEASHLIWRRTSRGLMMPSNCSTRTLGRISPLRNRVCSCLRVWEDPSWVALFSNSQSLSEAGTKMGCCCCCCCCCGGGWGYWCCWKEGRGRGWPAAVSPIGFGG